MTLQQLEYIVALDTHRHFVNAAESCFVTQPTLTLQVKKLEDEMGVLIFDRTKHPLVPTKPGQLVIQKARQILREAHQMNDLVNDDKDSLTGTIRLAIIPTLAPYLIPRFLGAFSANYPKIHLVIQEMESEQIIECLKSDTLDIGLLVTPLEEISLREIPLFNEPFLVYSSENHPFSSRSTIKPEEINSKGLWLLNQGHCFRNQVLNICNLNQKSTNGMNFDYESGSIETLKNLVKSNVGFTLVPELSVINEKNASCIKRFTSPEPVREVSIVTHKSFTKETLLEKLSNEILNNIPNTFKKGKQFKKVKWR
jgi:LysR family transcriptional regulator, hydrogen peroxide-inducible genes activator